MRECTVFELSKELEKAEITLLDVREYPEFAAGRIPDSRSLPLGEIASRADNLSKDCAVFVVCKSGRRSLSAQKQLIALGFKDVVNVKGGFDAWKDADLPFHREARAPWSLERQVRLAAGILILLGVSLSLILHPYFIAITAFVGAGLTFAGASDWCGMALLLAKMPWNKAPGNQQTQF